MAASQAVQVVFLSEPRIGERASVLINGQPATTSQIVNVQTDPRYPGCFWADTQSGNRYVGVVQNGQQTVPSKREITLPNVAPQTPVAQAQPVKQPNGWYIFGALCLMIWIYVMIQECGNPNSCGHRASSYSERY